MSKFYFTYGTEGHPFYGGWTEVIADSVEKAQLVFRVYHPDKIPGFLNCSSVYCEDTMRKTHMFREGNFGQWCHETICLFRTVN